jgi:DNA-binding HxlR family transcriptional regulator
MPTTPKPLPPKPPWIIPGPLVRGPSADRPLELAFELLGHKWALWILWELRDGPLGPRPLMRACGELSPTVMYDRIAELSEAGLVKIGNKALYSLTPHGKSLVEIMDPMEAWAKRWHKRKRAE